jgi:phytol kinase
LIKFTVILLYLFLIFLISIVFKKYNEDNKEIVRKIIHIGIGPLIPIAQFLKINQHSALIFTGIVSLMVFTNYNYKLFPTIEDVERKSYGTLFYCLSLFILIYLFWDKDPHALISGFFIMTFGDGLAGLIGKSFDSKSWIFFLNKKNLYLVLRQCF